jgi:general secretion pathway protein A
MALAAGAVVAGLVVIGWQLSPLFEKDASESPQLAAVQSADIGSTDVSAGLSVIAADAEATSSSDQVAMVEPSTTTPAKADNDKTLEQILTGPNVYTDTESAFTQLFSRWGLVYADYKGSTGCTRARKAGLRCIFRSGTWNNLRQLNRPAVIELLDGSGQRHHVLVTALDDNQISANFGGQEYDIPISEIDRYWYGQYLLLWKPLSSKQRVLRRGTRGEAVVWLRNILARYHGEPKLANGKDLFDRELEIQVKAFQRDHQLKLDGVVGRLTFIQLNTYDPEKAAPVLWKGPDRKAS